MGLYVHASVGFLVGKDKSTTINGYEGITNYLLITGSGAWLWCKAF